MLEAIKGINFNQAGWQAVWKGVREEEKKVHFKKEEGSHRKKAEEVSVGELWDDDDMVAMDDDEGDDSELANLKITKISMV